MHTPVLAALSSQAPSDDITVCGWVRTRRDAKAFSFLEINDGSCLRGIQVVVDAGTPGSESLLEMTTGASVEVQGKLVASQGKEQPWEIQAARISLVGPADDTYPLQKKGHSLEFIRSGVPGAQPDGLCSASVFPGSRVSERAYPHDHVE
jgi:asparaginyl-tRNA synthetase